MSLDKSITSGKSFRKQYRRSKVFDRNCRNHGSCPYCMNNRLHKSKLAEEIAEEAIEEYFLIEPEKEETKIEFGKCDFPSCRSKTLKVNDSFCKSCQKYIDDYRRKDDTD